MIQWKLPTWISLLNRSGPNVIGGVGAKLPTQSIRDVVNVMAIIIIDTFNHLSSAIFFGLPVAFSLFLLQNIHGHDVNNRIEGIRNSYGLRRWQQRVPVTLDRDRRERDR